jgi:hypothetical protein
MKLINFSEMNNQRIKIIKMKDNPKCYNKLMDEIDKIKNENDYLMNIINYIELTKVFNFEDKSS